MILVAGVGNIFLGDDAFGVEVAHRLAGRALPDGVTVRDFGIRGFDLAYAFMDGYDLVILVDATARGGAPGTLYVIEPDTQAKDTAINTHAMHPAAVLNLVRAMGGDPGKVLVVGCEPESLGEDGEGAMGLTAAVEAAVDPACRMIEEMIESRR